MEVCVHHVRLRALIDAGTVRGPSSTWSTGSVTFSHASFKNTRTLFGYQLVSLHSIRRSAIARFKDRDTLPLWFLRSCTVTDVRQKVPTCERKRRPPRRDTLRARTCAYVREVAYTKEPREMWLQRRARGCYDVIPTVPREFAAVSAITTGCEIGRFRSRGIETAPSSVSPSQILVGYLSARFRAPLLPRECFPMFLHGYFFDKHQRLS